MHRVRSNIRRGSWCALVALAIQIVLSFGHIDPPEFPFSTGSSPASAAAADGWSTVVSNAPPAPSKPIGPAFDYCAICAVMTLAGSVIPAAAPASPMPAGCVRVQFWAKADVLSTTSSHRLFQARAPPLA